MFRVWDFLPVTTKALSFISTFPSCKGCLLQILHREVLRKALAKFISKHSLGNTVEGKWIFNPEFSDCDLQHCSNWWKGSPVLHVSLTLREDSKPSQWRACLLILKQINHSDGRVLLILNLRRLLSHWNAVSLPKSKGSSLPDPAYLAKLTSHNLICSSSSLVREAFQVGWLIYPRFSMNIPGTLSVLGTLERLLFPLTRVLEPT